MYLENVIKKVVNDDAIGGLMQLERDEFVYRYFQDGGNPNNTDGTFTLLSQAILFHNLKYADLILKQHNIDPLKINPLRKNTAVDLALRSDHKGLTWLMFSYKLKDSDVANKEIVEELLPKYNKYVRYQERLNNLENKNALFTVAELHSKMANTLYGAVIDGENEKHIKRTNDFYMPKIHQHYRQMLKNYSNIDIKWKKLVKNNLHI